MFCGGPGMSRAADLENVIVYELSALGFGPFFEEQLQRWSTDAVIPARVAAEHRGGYEVWSNSGAGPARLAGRLRHRQDGEGAPAVGDWVALRYPPGTSPRSAGQDEEPATSNCNCREPTSPQSPFPGGAYFERVTRASTNDSVGGGCKEPAAVAPV